MTKASERALAARAASLRRWAREPDPVAAMAPARAGFDARFAREVDAMGITDPADRLIRIDRLRRAYMADLSRRSAAARRARAGGGER